MMTEKTRRKNPLTSGSHAQLRFALNHLTARLQTTIAAERENDRKAAASLVAAIEER